MYEDENSDRRGDDSRTYVRGGGRGRGRGRGRGGYDRNGGDDRNAGNDDYGSRNGSGYGGQGRSGGYNRGGGDENSDNHDNGGYKGRRDDDGGYRNRRDDNDGGYRSRRDDNDGGYKNRRDDNDNSGGFRSRDGGGFRGGRGGGRDGGNRFNNDDGNDGGNRDGGDGADEKPKESYVPPEPSNDTEEIFSGIGSGINFDKYDSIPVKVTGDDAPNPITSFEESGIRRILIDNVKRAGYSKPTPVQKYSLPIIMSGRDLMASAQTGSGKTAAFLIPIIHHLLECPEDLSPENCSPQVVVMSPTRELAIQIREQARKFAYDSCIKTEVAYGGTVSGQQANRLRRGVHILVATPGRLLDFVDKGVVDFSALRFFVLDEADRMLDMGFLPNVERVIDHPSMRAREERQSLMFSATFPVDIQRLAQKFLNNYLFLSVGIVGAACHDVEQVFYEVDKREKKDKLAEIVGEGVQKKERTLVFVGQKRQADFLACLLSDKGFPTTSIHGDRLQSQREQALSDFKHGRMTVLVATAVAARGLDIQNVAHVINFDLPQTIDEYVHRIGRTGRVGNKGKATSFFNGTDDSNLAPHLLKTLEESGQEIPDFLKSFSSAGGFYNNDDFGGEDFRAGGNAANAQAQEEDEDW